MAKALAICEQNSTAMPVAITRFTSEIAFSEISQTTMTPRRFRIMSEIVMATQMPVATPSRIIVTNVTQRIQIERLMKASLTIVRYCS